MSSPTTRSLAELRKRGYQLVDIVERRKGRFITHDCFDILDIIAIRIRWMRDVEMFGLQCTSGDNVASRVDKITNSDAIHVLRLAGWSIAVWGWRKSAKGRYVLREVELA